MDVAGWPLRTNHVMLGMRGHYKKGEVVTILMNNISDYMHWDNSTKDNPGQSPRESMIALMSTQDDLGSMGINKDNRSFTNRNINMRNNLAQMIAVTLSPPPSSPQMLFDLHHNRWNALFKSSSSSSIISFVTRSSFVT